MSEQEPYEFYFAKTDLYVCHELQPQAEYFGNKTVFLHYGF